jgi:NADH:ubiquinone oxidoreductase subunit 6 (subunit J)
MRFRVREVSMRIVLMMAIGLLLMNAAPSRAEEIASRPATAAGSATAYAPDSGGASGNLVSPGSTIEALAFYAVGGVAALCALGCVITTNIVRMAVCLFGTLGSVAILYFLMAANFLGAIQLIVYAGGTLIVIIFGVMLTSKAPWVKFVPRPVEVVAGAVVCGALFIGMLVAIQRMVWSPGKSAASGFTVEQIGRDLLTTYLVPFELASVLLLAVMIGAAYLARTEKQ